MTTYYRKKGDTKPAFSTTLRNGTAPVDLTTATSVRFLMRASGAASPKVNAVMTVASPATSGVVSYQLVSGDVDTAGKFNLEIEVTWSGGGVQTFPARGYDEMVITSDLGGAA